LTDSELNLQHRSITVTTRTVLWHCTDHILWFLEATLLTYAPPVKNWRILLEQSFNADMPLLATTSTFGLGRRRLSSPQ